MQLTPRQIRARLAAAVARAGTARAPAKAVGLTDSRVSRCVQSGANVPAELLAAAGMVRDAEGDIRDVEPARIQFIAVQASREAATATPAGRS